MRFHHWFGSHHRCGDEQAFHFAGRGRFRPFGGDDELGGPFGGRHGGARFGRMFGHGDLKLILLALIAEQPRHGYQLIRTIEEMFGGSYAPSPGAVYPTLTMLEEMGFIEQSGGEGARKPYQITDSGRAHLEENEEEADELVRRLKALSPSHSAEGGSPIWRAMRNLGQAIRNRVAHGEITDETKFELAALIDELAQKIERLK